MHINKSQLKHANIPKKSFLKLHICRWMLTGKKLFLIITKMNESFSKSFHLIYGSFHIILLFIFCCFQKSLASFCLTVLDWGTITCVQLLVPNVALLNIWATTKKNNVTMKIHCWHLKQWEYKICIIKESLLYVRGDMQKSRNWHKRTLQTYLHTNIHNYVHM